MTIDLDRIVAIDVHTHAEIGRGGEDGLRPEWREAARRYFGEETTPTVDEVAAYYRERTKYFPPQLVRYANTQLRDRVVFGSDYPMITPDRWPADFEQAGFKDDVRPLILKENAIRMLGLR